MHKIKSKWQESSTQPHPPPPQKKKKVWKPQGISNWCWKQMHKEGYQAIDLAYVLELIKYKNSELENPVFFHRTNLYYIHEKRKGPKPTL